MRSWQTVAVLFAVVGVPGAAEACETVALLPLVLDEAEMAVDTTPPASVTVDAVEIWRGRGAQQDGCGQVSSTSCDDIGRVQLVFTAPADDRTGADALGYRVVLSSGALPDGLTLPTTPVKRFGETFVLVWVDGSTDDQEPIDFTLALTTVDLAGNESAPVEVHVSDEGSGEGGCRIGGSRLAPLRAPVLWLAAFAAVALATRGRRRRRRP